MDWADDIAYSVHDIEDFHRCGVIPWRNIFPPKARGDTSLSEPAETLVRRAYESWYGRPPDGEGRLRDAMRWLEGFIRGGWSTTFVEQPYIGTRDQREALRALTSRLIGRYIQAIKLNDADGTSATVVIAENQADEVRMLKQITRDYIISNPSLAAQQKGQMRIIKGLFETLMEDSSKGPPKYLPTRLVYLWSDEISRERFVADCISSLSEAEATGLHSRLSGQSSGSVLDPIVR